MRRARVGERWRSSRREHGSEVSATAPWPPLWTSWCSGIGHATGTRSMNRPVERRSPRSVEAMTWGIEPERVTGIEPALSAWETGINTLSVLGPPVAERWLSRAVRRWATSSGDSRYGRIPGCVGDRRAVTAGRDPQDLKKVWHCVAHFGRHRASVTCGLADQRVANAFPLVARPSFPPATAPSLLCCPARDAERDRDRGRTWTGLTGHTVTVEERLDDICATCPTTTTFINPGRRSCLPRADRRLRRSREASASVPSRPRLPPVHHSAGLNSPDLHRAQPSV